MNDTKKTQQKYELKQNKISSFAHNFFLERLCIGIRSQVHIRPLFFAIFA